MASKRKTPSINGSSSADMAFILLIFFLITTSMGSDKGIPRRLPPAIPPDQQNTEVEIKKRNMLRVLVNTQGQILANGQIITLDELREKTKAFILNENDDPELPERVADDIPGIGNVMRTKHHIISLTNNVDTKYADYIMVQNELARAYAELREDYSLRKFNKHFVDLTDEQRDAVMSLYPQKISEANPKEYGPKK